MSIRIKLRRGLVEGHPRVFPESEQRQVDPARALDQRVIGRRSGSVRREQPVLAGVRSCKEGCPDAFPRAVGVARSDVRKLARGEGAQTAERNPAFLCQMRGTAQDAQLVIPGSEGDGGVFFVFDQRDEPLRGRADAVLRRDDDGLHVCFAPFGTK